MVSLWGEASGKLAQFATLPILDQHPEIADYALKFLEVFPPAFARPDLPVPQQSQHVAKIPYPRTRGILGTAGLNGGAHPFDFRIQPSCITVDCLAQLNAKVLKFADDCFAG
jgi:hypothetical protein